ncbi:MAG: MFS transporter [Burkholderiales bacterium]|nr:MFS transporter [Burkholderiales bacterium]
MLFLAFAFAYFFSALLRAVTATLAPQFSHELALGAGQLGLLAGAYFLGFSAMQLPLGHALDRFGPKRSLLVLLGVAIVGCLGFAAAQGFVQLLLARFVIGVGVSACLMAPLTCYRLRFGLAAQLRTNSWMLMTGSLGMLASTLPVQWVLPLLGWRGLFLAAGGLLLLSALLIALVVPADELAPPSSARAEPGSYATVWRNPTFIRLAPLGFFAYGGMIAMQTLWIGPWLTQVGGRSADEAAQGLFIVNASMLLAFLCWGLAMPRLTHAGWRAERIIAFGWPMGVACLVAIVWLGPQAGAPFWALWCVGTSVVSVSQPAVAQAFAPGLAGRALSAYNLVIFAGVFAVQWGIGLLLDALGTAGWPLLQAYRWTFGLFLGACIGSFIWFYRRRPEQRRP